MFDKLLKKFLADIIPRILPDILREIAASIEAGNGATVTPEQVNAIMDARSSLVQSCLATVNNQN